MRFSRDLPSSISRPARSSTTSRWIVLTTLTFVTVLFVMMMQSSTPTTSPPADDDTVVDTTLSNFNVNNDIGSVDRQPKSTDVEVRHIVMIDAGSSGSRIHIFPYTWDRSQPKSLPDIQPSVQKKLKPGLSAHAKNPEGAKKTISELLDVASANVPLAQRSSTPVYLQATAGLRSVTPEEAEAVLDQVRDLIEGSGFLFKREWARIIDGREEGIFGWLSANYLLKAFEPDGPKTRGIVEMGGASMQLTFVPDTPLPEVNVDTDKIVDVVIHGTKYKLYTHSYLGYGLEAVQEKHQHSNAVVDAVDLMGNPCYPQGYHHSSIGNWTLCYEWLQSVIPPPNSVACPYHSCGIETIYQPAITTEQFYAIENFFYTSKYFKVASKQLVSGLRSAGTEYCSRTWEDITSSNMKLDPRADIADLVKYCFATAYSSRVLGLGFGMVEGGTMEVEAMQLINDRPIDWALGSALNSLLGGTIKSFTTPTITEIQQSNVNTERLNHAINGANASAVHTQIVWFSIAMVPIVACYVIVKQVLPKWRR